MAEPDPEMSAEEFIEWRKARIAKKPGITAKDVLQTGKHRYRIEATTFHVQSNNRRKVHTVERIRWEEFESTSGGEPRRPHEERELAYRIGYWVVNRAGTWQWGQYSLISPAGDLDDLLEKARNEGTLLPESGEESALPLES
jgi:hypothetical protein